MPAQVSPLAVRGLEDFWARGTGRLPPRPFGMAERVLLDALGLGLEQTLGPLRTERPDYPAFETWVLATAGVPDPGALARYHNWLDGLPAPEAVQHRLRAIEDAPAVLDPADLAHWQREGYVIVRNSIAPQEAEAAAALVWRTIGAAPDDRESWYDRRSNGIMVQHFQAPEMECGRRSPRVHKAFAQLWGTADLWTTADRLGFNPPERPGYHFQGTPLHWDASIAPPIPVRSISAARPCRFRQVRATL